MPPTARLSAPDREAIIDLDSWFAHAPPEKGTAQWKDGYSAKEQAKAWLRSGRPMIPEELWSAIAPLTGDADDVYGGPSTPPGSTTSRVRASTTCSLACAATPTRSRPSSPTRARPDRRRMGRTSSVPAQGST
jgi:hypothetical protein